MFRRVVLIAGVAVLVAPRGAGAGDREEMLRVAKAHAAAVERIRTLHFKVAILEEGKPYQIPGGEYWKSGEKHRLHWTERDCECQATVVDGIARSLTKQDIINDPGMLKSPKVRNNTEGGRYFWHGMVERYAGRWPYSFHPWMLPGYCVGEGGGVTVSLDEFMARHAGELRSVRRVGEGKERQYEVEFQLSHWKCTYRFDPAMNYNLSETRVEETTTGEYVFTTHSGFREVAPGVYFCDHTTSRLKDPGRNEYVRTHTFSDIQVNRPIPDSVFDLKYRHGIFLADSLEGTTYPVNERGLPIGPKTPTQRPALIPLDPAGEEPPAVETQVEPPRSGWWILPSSLTLLCGVAVVVIIRRRRTAK